jgi:carbon monoxide dehydrogenase subunit G
MYIERTFVLDAPLQRAWAFLNEPKEMGGCLPGCHTVEVVETGKYKASVGLKVGPIKVGFDVQVSTDEERPPEYAAYTMRGSDKDGSSKISANCTLALKSIESQRTEITYTSNVQIVGKLGKFAGGVMQKFADGINDQFIAALSKRIAELESSVVQSEKDSASSAGGLKAIFRKLLEIIRRYF